MPTKIIMRDFARLYWTAFPWVSSDEPRIGRMLVDGAGATIILDDSVITILWIKRGESLITKMTLTLPSAPVALIFLNAMSADVGSLLLKEYGFSLIDPNAKISRMGYQHRVFSEEVATGRLHTGGVVTLCTVCEIIYPKQNSSEYFEVSLDYWEPIEDECCCDRCGCTITPERTRIKGN